MEVKAVISVVTRKLMDMVHEESVPHTKVVTRQLKAVQESLEKVQRFSLEENDSDTSMEHLRILYEIEDEIEKFTFRSARQRKKFGFLLKQTLLFNNLNSRRKLRQKMKKISSKIERINQSNPPAVEGTTPCSTINSSLHSDFDYEQSSQHNSLSTISVASSAEPEEEYDSNDDYDQDAHALPAKSSSAIWPIPEIQSPRSPKCGISTRSLSAISDLQEPMSQRKKLTFSYSHDEEEMAFVGIKEERLQHPKMMSSFSYEEKELGIFGFDDDVNSLVERLTEQQEKFVPIVGEAGSGKTTLARAVYSKRKIKDHFEICFWVSVSKEENAKHILRSLLKKVASFKEIGAMSQEQQVLQKELINHLKEKRYLIVLDGVGSCGMLEDLKAVVNTGSKIIFTSCEVWISQEMDLLPHNMKPLSEDESWNMFLKKAGKQDATSEIPWKLKCRILDICKGLPLNIVLVAGLFSTKRTKQWPSLIAARQSSDDVLSLCYNDLRDVSKLCLLYMALFPKGYDIPVRRLLRLWLAEGFVKRRSQELPEDFVQKLFENLVNRSLIQITKLRSDNSPRRCRLVAVLHDYLLPKAQDTSLFHIHRNLQCCADAVGPFGIRRMIQYISKAGTFATGRRENTMVEREKSEKDVPTSVTSSLTSFFSSRREGISTEISYPHPTPFDLQQTQSENSAFNPSLLRTYVSFNIQRRDAPGKEVGVLLGRIIGSGFGLLRVLDLEGICRPTLPQNLGHLCHLRYLGLRWTFLDSLPKSVGDLLYLETLDVKHTRIDSLPDSIWKLKYLRHLNLNNIRLALPPSSSSTLLTLWGLVVDEKISVKEGLGKLQALKELGITFNLNTSQDVLIDWITRLIDLQSLRLRSVDDMAHPSKLVLKPLSNLGKLSHLNLLGNLERLPNQHEFPPTLKVLTLSVSRLNDDPMKILGELPCLIVLRLLAKSYTGMKMVCHHGGFKKLRVLKLWVLEELEEWDIEEESMESLKELDIRCCHKLNNIPCRLLQEGCLDQLILTDMPDEFKARVMERKSKYTSLTINTWKLPPLP